MSLYAEAHAVINEVRENLRSVGVPTPLIWIGSACHLTGTRVRKRENGCQIVTEVCNIPDSRTLDVIRVLQEAGFGIGFGNRGLAVIYPPDELKGNP